MHEHLFLCGCARSGTSVLQRVLAGHADIALGMERYIRRFRQSGHLSPDLFEKERFFDVREGDTFYPDLSRFERTYSAMADRYDQCRYVGDKIPLLYRGYDAIFESFPNARFIFISRGIWDVASSFKRRALNESDPTWGDGRGVADAIREWNDAHRLTAEAMQRHGDRIFVVNYEKLFGEWSGLEAMFDFLSLTVSGGVKKIVNNEKILGERKRGTKAEVLTMDEQLQILASIDLASYRVVNARWLDTPVEHQPATPRMPMSRRPGANAAVQGNAGKDAAPTTRLRKYQIKDARICDYRYTKVPGAEVVARGPLPAGLAEGRFISYLGGAQTLGRFVQRPYPSLIEAETGWSALNLGFGGGKPEFYLNAQGALDVVNAGACAVVQVMSARGSPNSIIRAVRNENNFVRYHGRNGGEATDELFVDHAYRRLLREESPETITKCLQETREAWVRDMSQLLNAIRVPKLLLWFSVRTPHYVADTRELAAFLGPYPQFVDEAMLERLRPLADRYVECVSSRGMPSQLVDRATGEPVPVFADRQAPALNTYYPSPEMHEDAAALAAPQLLELLASRQPQRAAEPALHGA